MNGNKTTVLVILLGYLGGLAVFIVCALHLRQVVNITTKIESTLRSLNSWLDDLIKESFQNLDRTSR